MPQFLSKQKASEMTCISVRTIEDWLYKRKFKKYKFGRLVRIKENDLLGFLKKIEAIDEKSKNIKRG